MAGMRGLFSPSLLSAMVYLGFYCFAMDMYDGPRGLQIFDLFDWTMRPSIAGRRCIQSVFQGLSSSVSRSYLNFLFNEGLYFAERNDEAQSEEKRFRNALSRCSTPRSM